MSIYPSTFLTESYQYFLYTPNTSPGVFAVDPPLDPSVEYLLNFNLNALTGEVRLTKPAKTLNSTLITLTKNTVTAFDINLEVRSSLNNTFYFAAFTSVSVTPTYTMSFPAAPPVNFTYELVSGNSLDTFTVYPTVITQNLLLNFTTGVIAGTLSFLDLLPLTTLLIKQTAYNALNVKLGTAYTYVKVAVDVVPTFFYQEDVYNYVPGDQVNIVPIITSDALGVIYSLAPSSPGLPIGLTLNFDTGSITGVASAQSIGLQQYQINAQTSSASPAGFSSAKLNLGINTLGTAIYAGSPFVLTQDTPVALKPLVPTNAPAQPIKNAWSPTRELFHPFTTFGNMAAAYHNANDIVFVGNSNPNYNGTWQYNSVTQFWTNLNTNTAPSARYEQSWVYNSFNNIFVLFGGVQDVPTQNTDVIIKVAESYKFFNETWFYDPQFQEWTRILTANAPSPRAGASMVYDVPNNRLILFGGFFTIGLYYSRVFYRDTWTFNFATRNWTQIPTLNAPSSRLNAGIVYDPDRGHIILAGGVNLINFPDFIPIYLRDTFYFLNNNWVLQPATFPLTDSNGQTVTYENISLIYDALKKNVLLSWAQSKKLIGNSTVSSTLIYGIDNQWHRLNPLNFSILNLPLTPYGQSIGYSSQIPFIYNESANYTLLFIDADTFKLQVSLVNATAIQANITYIIESLGSTNWNALGASASPSVGEVFTATVNGSGTGTASVYTWSTVITAPAFPGIEEVVYKENFTLMYAFNSNTNEIFLFTKGETWTYYVPLQVWTKRIPVNNVAPPINLKQGTLVYNSLNDEYILCCGAFLDYSTQETNTQTWIYENANNRWISLLSGPRPTRVFASAAFDPINAQVVLFGGNSAIDTNFQLFVAQNDTWTFDVQARLWLQVVITSPTPPSPRQSSAMVYDPISGNVILFGGIGSTNNIYANNTYDDLWVFNGNTNAWSLQEVSLQEVTLKPLSREGSNLVYDPTLQGFILYGGINCDDVTEQNIPVIDSWLLRLPLNGLLASWTDLNATFSPKQTLSENKWFLFNILIFDPDQQELVLLSATRSKYVMTPTLPPDPVQSPYNTTFSLINCTNLPYGLSLNANTGVISGTPTVLTAPYEYVIAQENTAGGSTTTLILSVERKDKGTRALTNCAIYSNPMQRKADVLKYPTNRNKMTKAQQWAQAVNGIGKRTYATQGIKQSNPNTANLPVAPDGLTLICASPAIQCAPTFNSDVPGPVMLLCDDTRLPPVNASNVRRTYTMFGSKWPQSTT
jgi:N-acetylneuraminic acid mutarotase